MTQALIVYETAAKLKPVGPCRKSGVHRVALALVWLTVALSGFVFAEPAPVDFLTFGLFVLLPVIGLTDAKPGIAVGLVLWLLVGACGLMSAAVARDIPAAVGHMGISVYLYASCFLFAAFVARNPQDHIRLILNAHLVASVVVACLGIIGYLNIIPGAFDLLTRYGRATATFKDPNVFGPFTITGLLTALHLWLTRPVTRSVTPSVMPLLAAALQMIAILFTFSRGAWAATGVALAVFGYFYLLTAARNIDRLKLAGLVLLGSAVLGLVIAASLQSDQVSRLMTSRVALTQSYDEGVEGRFGGQEKAINLILENPAGIGARDFTRFYHHEEVHNVYLSMMLNSGWFGGLVYLMICAGTLMLAFDHAMLRTKTQPLFLVVMAALAGNIAEGVLIDSDHWRHFYLLMGLVWGLMAGDRRELRAARIVRDVRPILMRKLLIVPPSRRDARLVARVPNPVIVATAAARRLPGDRPKRRAKIG